MSEDQTATTPDKKLAGAIIMSSYMTGYMRDSRVTAKFMDAESVRSVVENTKACALAADVRFVTIMASETELVQGEALQLYIASFLAALYVNSEKEILAFRTDMQVIEAREGLMSAAALAAVFYLNGEEKAEATSTEPSANPPNPSRIYRGQLGDDILQMATLRTLIREPGPRVTAKFMDIPSVRAVLTGAVHKTIASLLQYLLPKDAATNTAGDQTNLIMEAFIANVITSEPNEHLETFLAVMREAERHEGLPKDFAIGISVLYLMHGEEHPGPNEAVGEPASLAAKGNRSGRIADLVYQLGIMNGALKSNTEIEPEFLDYPGMRAALKLEGVKRLTNWVSPAGDPDDHRLFIEAFINNADKYSDDPDVRRLVYLTRRAGIPFHLPNPVGLGIAAIHFLSGPKAELVQPPLNEADAAKQALSALLDRPPWLTHVGIGHRDDGTPFISVGIQQRCRAASRSIPLEVRGFQVVVEVTGEYEAQEASDRPAFTGGTTPEIV